MPLQPAPAVQFLAGMVITCGAVLALGVYTLLPDGRLTSLLREFARTDWKYIGVAWLVTALVNELAKFHQPLMFTTHIYGLEGNAVAAFQAVTALPLTLFFSAVYLVGFPFLVLFTYFKLKAHAEEEAYRYALAYVCLVVLSAPLFVLFPARVVGPFLPQVKPLLYSLHPAIWAGLSATDTLVKSFPSLHTALSTLVALFARGTTKRFAYTVYVLAASIVFSTFYLGMHWFVDAGFAIVLAVAAYAVATRVDPDRVLPFPGYRWVVRSIASRGD